MLLLLLTALVKILAKVPLMVYLSNNLLLGAALEYIFVSLTVFMVFMTIVTIRKAKAQERIIMFILFVLILLFFYETKLIIFYIWYELSLLPMFLIIIFYGYQPERLTARISLIFYTLMASSPLLVVLLILRQTLNTENFALWRLKSLHINMNTLMCFTICLSFLVKLPMYPFHLWLPKAHVEAPVYGSIILAAVMLKIGRFGLIRIWEGRNSQMLGKILFAVRLVRAFHIRRYNLAELDIKVVIAYSSVAHIAVLLTAFLSIYSWGIFSILFTSVAHGVSSSLLFYGAFFNLFT